jgi:hypothetical protein
LRVVLRVELELLDELAPDLLEVLLSPSCDDASLKAKANRDSIAGLG